MADLSGAASALLASPLRTMSFVGCAGLLHLASALLLHVAVALPSGFAREMDSSPTFRSKRELAMLYPPLLGPFVQALLTLLLALALFREPAVSRWAWAEAASFTTAVWLCTSAHGIWLDYCVFRISWRPLLQFLLGSFVAALTTAFALVRVFGRQ